MNIITESRMPTGLNMAPPRPGCGPGVGWQGTDRRAGSGFSYEPRGNVKGATPGCKKKAVRPALLRGHHDHEEAAQHHHDEEVKCPQRGADDGADPAGLEHALALRVHEALLDLLAIDVAEHPGGDAR